MANNISPDLQPIITESRKLSIAWKHGFISCTHIFVAMLQLKCLASPYLEHCDTEWWTEKVKAAFPATATQTANDKVALTVDAERACKHSFKIAALDKRPAADTVHLLLAFLSFENDISKAFSKAGITISDITSDYFSNPIAKLPPALKQIRNKPYNKSELFFFLLAGKKRELLRLRHNAHNLYAYRQYKDCGEICAVALTLFPGNLELSALQIYCHINLLNFDESVTGLKKLIAEKPDSLNYRLLLSYVYTMTGAYDESAGILDSLLLEEPQNIGFLNNQGFNMLKQGQFEKAAPYFESAVKEDPTFAYSLNNLGFVMYKLGNTDEGLGLINKSLGLDKSNSYAYRNKGIIDMETDNKPDAIKNFELALKYGFTERFGDEVEQLLKDLM